MTDPPARLADGPAPDGGPDIGGWRAAVSAFQRFYWDSGLSDDVPALAWFLVSSLAPLALGLAALATLALGDAQRAERLAAHVAHVLPPAARDEVVQLVLRTRRDSPLLLLVSVVAMLWTSSGGVGVIERALSRLLGRRRFGPVVGLLRRLGLAAVVAILILLMVATATAATNIGERLGLSAAEIRWPAAFASLALTTTGCAALYRAAPRGSIGWAAAFAGGAVAGVVLQLTPTVAGVYIALVGGRTPVKVFLVLAGLLFTCWVASLGLLVGAGIAVRMHTRRGGAAPRDGDAGVSSLPM